MNRAFTIVIAGLIVSGSGCHYFDFQHRPTGYSSTRHKAVVEEKVRDWQVRQKKLERLAERRRKLAEQKKQIATSKSPSTSFQRPQPQSDQLATVDEDVK